MDNEIEKRKHVLEKYGMSSLSYLTLSDNLDTFCGEDWDGYFAYNEFLHSNIILSDPVVPFDHLDDALTDLIDNFTKDKKHIGFFLCTHNVVKKLVENGFKAYYFGSEAVVHLKDFTISGNKNWKIRSSVNYAKKHNMVVEEYEFNKNRDFNVESDIATISEEWKKTKKEPELNFAFGKLDFSKLTDSRYFICRYKEEIVGFIVLYPIFGSNSYYLDLTRRSKNAPRGVIDFLFVECFNLLKSEGVNKVYIGFSPLSFLHNGLEINSKTYINFLENIYPVFQFFYPAGSEFFFKRKYATKWEPNYICFYPRISINSLFGLLHSVYEGGFACLFSYKIRNNCKHVKNCIGKWLR